ncbi:P2Y purinoceptor 3 [Aplochiton taeniatus]
MRLGPLADPPPVTPLAEPDPRDPTSSASPCSIDESYKYIFLPVCYSLTFLFSLSLNSVVLLRSCRRRGNGGGAAGGRRWTTSLIYMVNLATTDLMYGLSLPLLVASYVQRDHWLFGDFMCRLVRFLFYFNLYCSIFFLTCISVHRYLGICHPMKTVTMESRRVVKATCALVWVVVFLLTCPIFRFAQTTYIVRGGGGRGGGGGGGGNSTGSEGGSGGPGGPEGGSGSPEGTPGGPEGYVNCWDDAVDSEFADYVPYGMVLHLLGFFVPFLIIAYCYSQVVRTICRTLRSPPSSRAEEGGAAGGAASVSGSQHSLYIRRRRKSIKTIVTITLLFALCFLPFHVTRTLFLLLRQGRPGSCHAMKAVSICYKVTRPLASCNAWLNALLYFLTGDHSAPCCWARAPALRRERRSGTLWPLQILRKEGAGEEEDGPEKKERVVHVENDSKSSRIVF